MAGKRVRRIIPGAAAALIASCALAQPVPVSIPVPGGEGGVGFDDLRYSAALGKVLVPAAGSGILMLIEPAAWRVTRIDGFSTSAYSGGHDDGVTSADEGRGFVFVVDRTALRLAVVDPSNGRVVSWSRLAGSPDYVRYVEPTGEVWVTQPDKERIEVFRLEDNPPRPVHDAFIDVPGGPESLVVDAARGRAYTNLWKGKTVAIHTKNRGVGPSWPNGCEGSRGIALDEERGFVFVGCAEGRAVTLDGKSGKVLGKVETGGGVDLVDYNRTLSHLYIAAGKSGTLGIAAVLPAGGLSLLAEVPTAAGAHCVAVDASAHAYVCDPKQGRIIVVPDGEIRPVPAP